MASVADAIAGIESAGQQNPYAAVGPQTRTGDRAYGRYQVMGNNIGPWTQEVLGRPLSIEEFVANPQAQDAVFNAKFEQARQKYGNPQDAASVWFTGKPLAQGANRADVNGMTGQEYVARFTRNLGGEQSPASPQAPASGNLPIIVASGTPQQATAKEPDLASIFAEMPPPPQVVSRQNSAPTGAPFRDGEDDVNAYLDDQNQQRIFAPRTTGLARAKGRRA